MLARARRRGEMLIQEQPAELRVERIVAGEPLFRARLFPEFHHLRGNVHHLLPRAGAPRQAIIIIRRSAGGGPTCRCAG
ncbi:hypothetical protein G6F31_014831 [Rhizopus arrhizus]|nr:hypothetical protein G6F31_014831 [Rhizopus arrhizus]